MQSSQAPRTAPAVGWQVFRLASARDMSIPNDECGFNGADRGLRPQFRCASHRQQTASRVHPDQLPEMAVVPGVCGAFRGGRPRPPWIAEIRHRLSGTITDRVPSGCRRRRPFGSDEQAPMQGPARRRSCRCPHAAGGANGVASVSLSDCDRVRCGYRRRGLRCFRGRPTGAPGLR